MSTEPSLIQLDSAAEALHRAARYDNAIALWRQALDLALTARDADQAARLYVKMANAHRDRGDGDQAHQVIEEGLTVLDGAPDSEGIAMLHRAAAQSQLTRSLIDRLEPALAGGQLDEAEALLEALHSIPLPAAQSVYDRCWPYFLALRGDLDAAEPLFHAAFAHLLADPSNATDHVLAIGGLGAYYSFCLIWGGRWREAGEVIEHTIARVEQHPAYQWLADDWSRLVLCYLRQGRKSEADRALQHMKRHLAGLSPHAQAAEMRLIKREYARAEGHVDDALALSRQIIAASVPDPYLRWLHEDIAAMLVARDPSGDRAGALRHLRDAQAVAAGMGAVGWVARIDAQIDLLDA